jgi:VCBS repeat-containing protein
MFGPKKRRVCRQTQTRAKRLHFELLEPRRLLTAAALVEPHQFRADDFSIAGSFSYVQYDVRGAQGQYNYKDQLSGTYSSTMGHIAWTSANGATGSLAGRAVGSGSMFINNSKVNNYGIEETGQFEFSIESASQLHIVARLDPVTNYTFYEDKSNGQFPQPIPTSHFFGGDPASYSGTFDTLTQKAAINYSQLSPDTTANSPAATLVWADQTATDMVLTIENKTPPVSVPAGWASVPPTSQLAAAVDLAQGLEFTVDVHGKPVPTANVEQPVGTVRFYWAASATDMTGQEIPVTADAGTLDVYWNSSRLHALVTQFPARPANASFLRVTIDAAPGADASASNSTQFVAIFQASSDTSGPVSEDSLFDGQAASLLAAADFAEPDIKIEAYTATSSLGAAVQVLNQRGGYQYDPTAAPQIQALAQGETANDVIQFLAVKAQAAGSLASHTITVTGVNDPPVAGEDTSATASFRKLLLAAETLLSNDTDVDHNDVITVNRVDSTSQRGAAIRAILDENAKIVQIEYDPAASDELKSLSPGQQLTDEFTYEIVDQQGTPATGRVVITVTGSQPLTISFVPPQCTTSDQPTAAIAIIVSDPDGDANSLQLSGQAANPDLIPNANLQFGGSGQQRQLVITPVLGTLGRTWIQVTVSDDLGRSASVSFPLVVGLAEDLDLDGVPNDVEDAGPNGDMNGDGIPDRYQSNVATLRVEGSEAFLSLTVPEQQAFSQVTSLASPVPSGPGANAEFPLGLVHYELLVDSPGAASTVTFRTNLATPALNRFYQYDASPGDGWRTFMDSGVEGARVFADRIEIKVRDGGRADQSNVPDGRIIAEGAPAHVTRPWQNDSALDVNNDGLVSPLDVLTLINQINLGRSETLGELPQGTDSLPPFVDPDGDNQLLPLDVLIVINYLNSRTFAEGEGSAPAVAAVLSNASVPLGLADSARDTAVWQATSGRSPNTNRPVVGPVQPLAARATAAKRQAEFAADVDSILAEVGHLAQTSRQPTIPLLC